MGRGILESCLDSPVYKQDRKLHLIQGEKWKIDYWLELYVKPTDIPLLGLSEEYVYWAGDKHSRDPAIYVSANGIRFEAITDAAHFRAVTNMELPKGQVGLFLPWEILSAFAWQAYNGADADDLLSDFILNIDKSAKYIILLCRYDETVTDVIRAGDASDVICALKTALDYNNPKDIMLIHD